MKTIVLIAGVAGILGTMAMAAQDAQAVTKHRHHAARVVSGGNAGAPGRLLNFNPPGRPQDYIGPGGYYYEGGDRYFGRGRLSGGGRKDSEAAGGGF